MEDADARNGGEDFLGLSRAAVAVGSRVMFTGPYGVRENGARQEWLLARPDDLALVPAKRALTPRTGDKG
jgi:hypothetical protein